MKKIILGSLFFSAVILVGSSAKATNMPSSSNKNVVSSSLKAPACLTQTKSSSSLQSCGVIQKDTIQKKDLTLALPSLPVQPSAQTPVATKKTIAAETPVYVQCSGPYLGNDGTASGNLDSGVQCLGPFNYNIQQQINAKGGTIYPGPWSNWSVSSGMSAMHLNSDPGYGSGAFRTYLLTDSTDPGSRCCCVKKGYLIPPGKSTNNGGTYTMRCDGPAAP